MEIESICKKMAEDWIDGGGGPNLFVVSISSICGYIDEKREKGSTCLSAMASTWWLNGGNSQGFVENSDLILKLIKEGK